MQRKLKVFGLAFVLTVTIGLWGADGATLYKGKCAGCHGGKGEGKSAMKAPALKGTSLDASQIADKLTKGSAGSKAPHSKPIHGVTAEQAAAIADYVKALQ